MVFSTCPSCPLPSPPISHPTPPFSTRPLWFLVPKCFYQLHFFTSHPHTSQSTSLWLYFDCMPPFLLMFFDNSLTFSGLLPAHLFLVSKASIASISFPIEHVQPLTPSTFTKLFFLNFFHHNITTRNSMPSCSQMFRPHTFLNITLTHLTIIIHILNTYYYYFKKQTEVTIRPPHSSINLT